MASTSFCKQCESIIIDNGKWGGYEATNSTGNTVLKWDELDFGSDYIRHDTYPDFPVLEASARTGCDFCRFLMDAIKTFYSPIFEELLEFQQASRTVTIQRFRYFRNIRRGLARQDVAHDDPSRSGPSNLRFDLDIPDSVSCLGYPADFEPYVTFDVLAELENPIAQYLQIYRRPLRGPLLSLSNASVIKSWIEVCAKCHKSCQETLGYLPSRLIDVGDHSGLLEPRLIETHNSGLSSCDPKSSRYIALSYCWGPLSSSRPLLKTTTNNYNKMLLTIPLCEMPQTLQDAVIIARALEFRYLWIDSLCIIQDNTSDWEKEAIRMIDTYSHSYLTIAAMSAASSHDGFLCRKLAPPTLKVPCRSINSQIVGAYFLRAGELQSEMYDAVETCPWSKRGWTFQEEILSTRVLYFGTSMLHFQCRDSLRQECTDASLPVISSALRKVLKPYQAESEAYSFWYRKVYKYSDRQLTFPNDILPAISGLARIVKCALGGDVYLAGLWRDDLAIGLLWYPGVRDRPNIYRGPSWSWTSRLGAVTWDRALMNRRNISVVEQCKVIDTRTTVLGNDPMGPVTSGYLTLSGKLKHLRKTQVLTRPSKWAARAIQVVETFASFQDIVLDGRTIAFGRMDEPLPEDAGAHESGQITDIWMLLLAKVTVLKTEDSNIEYHPELVGLLLALAEPDDTDRKTCYRRIGVFDMDVEDSNIAFPDSDSFQTITII